MRELTKECLRYDFEENNWRSKKIFVEDIYFQEAENCCSRCLWKELKASNQNGTVFTHFKGIVDEKSLVMGGWTA